MRSHEQIIKEAGAQALADSLGVSVHTVRSWAQRGAIPHERWAALIAAGCTTLEELSPELARVVSDKQGAAA